MVYEKEGGGGEGLTHSGHEALRPLAVLRARGGAKFPLGNQLSLSSCRTLDEGAGGAGNVLGCLQNLLLKVQRLVCSLHTGEKRDETLIHPFL